MVQEGAGLALLLGAADRRGLVQEVADGSLNEHCSPPKLGSTHASVSNLDAQLRSLAGASHTYPAYYSSYYHYYYGYPVSNSNTLQEQHSSHQQEHSSSDHSTEHGINGTPTTIAQATYDTTNYGLPSVDVNTTDYDLAGSSASSTNSASNNNHRQETQDLSEDFPSSPHPGRGTTSDFDIMSQQCSLSSSIKGSVAYQNLFETTHTNASNSQSLPNYNSVIQQHQNYPQASDFASVYSSNERNTVSLPSFTESLHQHNRNQDVIESTSDTEPDSSSLAQASQ